MATGHTKQHLINYHTGSLTNQPQAEKVEFGEIVVRHHADKPELLIKVSSGTSGQESYSEWFEGFMSSKDVMKEIQAAVVASEGELQQQVTTLGNKIDAVSATVTNNYWTSATTKSEIEAASAATLEEANEYADSQDDALSGRVITYVQQNITNAITGDVQEIQQKVSNLETFSGYVETNYATKAEVKTAKDEAVTSANTASNNYTDEKIQMLSGITSAYVANQLTATTEDVTDLQQRVGKLETFSGKVESDYATKEFVGSASGYAYNQAKTDLIGASTDEGTADTIWGAKNYADGINKTLSADVITYVNEQISDAGADIQSVSDRVHILSGTVSAMSGELKTYIDNELSTVYTYKDSVADIAALQAIANPEVGDVYNVVAANGEPGDDDYTPAGTNYAWNGSEWDALGGVVDLSNYTTTATTDALATIVTNLESARDTASSRIDSLSGVVSAFSSSVVTNYATSANTEAAIKAAKDEAVTSAYTASTAYTNEQIAVLSGVSSAYTDSKVSELQNSITTILTGYAFSSITHQEILDAKESIIGSDSADSSQTETLKGLKAYSDEKDRQLESQISNMLDSFSGAMSGDLTNIETQINDLSSRVSTNENKFTSSAATWNSALQHGELGEVSETAAGNGVTIQSGAKLKDDATNKKLVLDLTGLIIDCGEF
jgi:polyhydroxyalkanoate synthesis regulator phasin